MGWPGRRRLPLVPQSGRARQPAVGVARIIYIMHRPNRRADHARAGQSGYEDFFVGTERCPPETLGFQARSSGFRPAGSRQASGIDANEGRGRPGAAQSAAEPEESSGARANRTNQGRGRRAVFRSAEYRGVHDPSLEERHREAKHAPATSEYSALPVRHRVGDCDDPGLEPVAKHIGPQNNSAQFHLEFHGLRLQQWISDSFWKNPTEPYGFSNNAQGFLGLSVLR